MHRLVVVSFLLFSFAAVAGCSSKTSSALPAPADAGLTDVAADVALADVGAADAAPGEDALSQDAEDVSAVPTFCSEGGWSVRSFQAGPYGTHRHDVADDFTVALADGSTWNLKENFVGCESYVFVPDTIAVSDENKTTIWAKDLDNLIKKSPRNVHWFFVSRQGGKAATDAIAAMQARVMDLLNNLSEADANHWHTHLHVLAEPASALKAWPGDVLQTGHGQIGFAIDRFQRVRGFGMLADVSRSNTSKKWPWDSNLAYAAHEPIQYNAEVLRQEKLDAEDALVVPLWKGEVIEQYAEMDVTLTTATDLAKYDGLEFEIEQHCPNPDAPEPGNCGAWDYLAGLSVKQADGTWVEMARFITSYHRETHWVVDATPMLVFLRSGGVKRIRWEWAPEWNKQPTSTYVSLRFVHRGAADLPAEVTKLWDGGSFNSTYDSLHPDRTVTISSKAKRVELWALITGHGSDDKTHCSEFCNHQHVFTVGSKSWKKDHPVAGTSNQCMPNMDKGMVPNQGGTWWFGRGGWCPGMQVDPWIVDLTAQAPAGKPMTISYKGQLGGKTPPDGAGNIDGAVWLVTYE